MNSISYNSAALFIQTLIQKDDMLMTFVITIWPIQ